MTSAISSYGGYPPATQAAYGSRPRKPDASELAADLFSALDTQQQGYLQASDFDSAISALNGSSSSSDSTASDLFAALDSDSDGKVTQDELTTRLQELQSQLDSQFNAMRTQGMGGMAAMGGMGGMPPPPPRGNDAGLDQDQLTTMASDASASGDSTAAARFSSLAANFDAADSNGDGKVSFQESIAYEQSQSTSSDSASATASADNSSDSTQNARVLHRLMEMLRAYDSNDNDSGSQLLSTAV
ncbi:EF-hand domain-containing protein [Vogesella sp. GCM10023246]|uniref:EF-hand domain-containing protein n=1 Tax=Vogesella oryzagri TaxID=3160864 RepID=A0ABV1LZA7_9NEIS